MAKNDGTISGLDSPRKEYRVEQKASRYKRLDKLRDIAALMVVMSHIPAMAYNPVLGDKMPNLFFEILWALGAPAVDVFLVLSGYVVALSWLRQQERGGNPAGFFAARMMRLMPVYLISLGIALFCWSLIQTIANPASSAIKLGMENPGMTGIVASLGPFWPTEATLILNPPWWTLQIEFLAMFLIPPFVSTMMNTNYKVGFAFMAVVIVFQQAVSALGMPGSGQLFCIITVIAGSMAACAKQSNSSAYQKVEKILRSSRAKLIAGILAALMMSFSQYLRYEDFGYEITRSMGAIAAVLIILIATNSRRRSKVGYMGDIGTTIISSIPSGKNKSKVSALSLSPGETSYPLYAIHYPMMLLGSAVASQASGRPEYLIAGGLVGALLAYCLSVPIAKQIERNAVRRSSRFIEKRLLAEKAKKYTFY